MAKSTKRRELVERVEALKPEVDADLDRLAEERRPKGIGAVPAGIIRQLWMAKAGNLFDAYLLAAKEGK